MSYIKHLSKCPYSKKPLLPRKIPGCVPVCELVSNAKNMWQKI